MKTLIIIDVQNDFMPGGALEIKDGNAIIPVINAILPQFDLVVATQDWHPSSHKSFVSNHPNYLPFEKILLQGFEQTLWPPHCLQGSFGAELHAELDTKPIEAIFRKGTHCEVDSYSAFYDNANLKSTGLSHYLKGKGVKDIYFSGLAADVCVYHSITDALLEDYTCWLVEDATRALDEGEYKRIRRELLEKKVSLVSSNSLRR